MAGKEDQREETFKANPEHPSEESSNASRLLALVHKKPPETLHGKEVSRALFNDRRSDRLRD